MLKFKDFIERQLKITNGRVASTFSRRVLPPILKRHLSILRYFTDTFAKILYNYVYAFLLNKFLGYGAKWMISRNNKISLGF